MTTAECRSTKYDVWIEKCCKCVKSFDENKQFRTISHKWQNILWYYDQLWLIWKKLMSNSKMVKVSFSTVATVPEGGRKVYRYVLYLSDYITIASSSDRYIKFYFK